MAIDEGIRKLVANEERSLNRRVEVVDSVVLGSGPTEVVVALYRGEIEVEPGRRMIDWRLAALTREHGQRVTSVIVHTEWDTDE